MKASDLTGRGNYFEDFHVGDVLKHARGKTVEPMEQVWITNVTMNTAEAHFNEHLTQSMTYGRRLGFGGVTRSGSRDRCTTATRCTATPRSSRPGTPTVPTPASCASGTTA